MERHSYLIEPITPSEIETITHAINAETPDFGQAYAFGFAMRNPAGEMIAGVNGSVIYGVVYTDQLWVHPSYRKQGLGRALMEHVEAYGREQGCTMATVATMSFQHAQRFYETLGYQVDFVREGYVGGLRWLC